MYVQKTNGDCIGTGDVSEPCSVQRRRQRRDYSGTGNFWGGGVPQKRFLKLLCQKEQRAVIQVGHRPPVPLNPTEKYLKSGVFCS